MRESDSEDFLAQMDISIQVGHKAEVMRWFSIEGRMMQVRITENQLGSMEMMDEVSEHVGMNYPKISDYRYLAQTVINFLLLGRRRWDQPKSPSH